MASAPLGANGRAAHPVARLLRLATRVNSQKKTSSRRRAANLQPLGCELRECSADDQLDLASDAPNAPPRVNQC